MLSYIQNPNINTIINHEYKAIIGSSTNIFIKRAFDHDNLTCQ